MTPAAEAEPPWLTSDQVQDWKALMTLLVTLPSALDAQLRRDAGMNLFEYHVLVGLAEAPGHMLAMTELATMTRSSPSRLSHAVSRLERSGWVERLACQEAGRRTSAHLTAAGLQKLQESAPGHVREARRLVVDNISAEQLTALGTSARRIAAEAAPEIAAALDTEPRRTQDPQPV